MATKRKSRTHISEARKRALCADIKRLNREGLTQREVAKTLGLSTSTVRRWSVSLGLAWIQTSGGRRRYRVRQVKSVGAGYGKVTGGYDGMKRLAAAVLIPVVEADRSGNARAVRHLRNPSPVVRACMTLTDCEGSVAELLRRSKNLAGD